MKHLFGDNILSPVPFCSLLNLRILLIIWIIFLDFHFQEFYYEYYHFLIHWYIYITWFPVWLFLLLSDLSTFSARKNGLWYSKYSQNNSLLIFFSLFLVSSIKIPFSSDTLIFDPLGIEYGVFSDSVGNKLLLKPPRTSSLVSSKILMFF